MRYLEKLYTSKKGTNEILKYINNEETRYFIRVIRREKTGQVASVAFEFHGDYIRKSESGEEKEMHLCLREYIERYGAFRRTNKVYSTANSNGKSVVSVLFELTYNLPVSARLANIRPGVVPFNAVLQELGSVYDCTWMGFKGNGVFSPFKTNSCVFPGEKVMSVTCDGGDFQTEMQERLIHMLGTLEWSVRHGALRGRVPPMKDYFSYGEIVFSFYHGMLSGHERDVYSALKEMRDYFKERNLEVDHLTENKENNSCYTLVALPKDIHAKFKNFRTRIKEPYFFLMAYNPEQRKIKVSCGLVDGPEKRFIFNNYEDRLAMELLGVCFEEFKALVKKAGCFMRKPGRESLLYREGMPEKHEEENSLLELLAKAPEETFEVFTPGEFRTLPVVNE